MAVAVGSQLTHLHDIPGAAAATTPAPTTLLALLHGIFPIKVCDAGSEHDGRDRGTLYHREKEGEMWHTHNNFNTVSTPCLPQLWVGFAVS